MNEDGRVYPFQPKSTKELMIGDFWAVPLSDSLYGCAQITDLQRNGPGSLKTFVIGISDWHGSELPTAEDVVNSVLLEQGLTGIEAIGGDNSKILGNAMLPADIHGVSNFRNFEVGTITHTYGTKNLPNTFRRLLKIN